MTIKTFMYKGTQREVIVVEQSPSFIKGFDLSHLTDEKLKEELKETAPHLSLELLSEQDKKPRIVDTRITEGSKEFARAAECFKIFRQFTVATIKQENGNTDF